MERAVWLACDVSKCQNLPTLPPTLASNLSCLTVICCRKCRFVACTVRGIGHPRAYPCHTFPNTCLKPVLPGGEALQEVPHRRAEVVLTERVEHKRVADLHKRFDGTVLCDGDGETKRLKAGLGHPAGDHGGARVVVRSSDHVQAARDTRNGLELVTADGLELSETVLASERLREIGSCLLKRLVQRLRRKLLNAQRRGQQGGANVRERALERVDRLVTAAERLCQQHRCALLDGAGQCGERGARLWAVIRGGHDDQASVACRHRDDLLRVGAQHVHHFGLHARLGDAARERLAEAVAEAVIRGVKHRHGRLALLDVGRPVLVVAHQLWHVELQDGAMPVGNRLVGKVLHLAQRRRHALCVWLHQAVEVEAVVWEHRLDVDVKRVLCAVVEAERVARVHDARRVVKRKHGVWPMEVGRHYEFKHVAAAEVDLVAALDLLGCEGPVGEALQEGEADL
mmetsp:Transcript_30329/g.89966  ORF Transcript_30329/g.89966 Transcript_30329/m.89966 type:complete len:456 (+) Transcript_30329:922-2289(+)